MVKRTYIRTRNTTRVVEQESVNTKNTKKSVHSTKKVLTTPDDVLETRYHYNQIRKMALIADMVDINFDVRRSCFATLTFAENITDIKVAGKHWARFIKEMRRAYVNLKYLATVEFQDRGSIHYHFICNIADSADALSAIQKLWGHGTVDAKQTYDLERLVKYMTKEIVSVTRDTGIFGSKHYLNSQGLQRPKATQSWKKKHAKEYSISVIEELFLKKKAEYKTSNKDSGKIGYKNYYANNSKLFGDFVYAEKRK